MFSETFIRPETFWQDIGLRADQIVVHLGCGAGYYVVPAARLVGKNGRVVGVDIRPDMLAETENRARQSQVEDIVQTARMDIESGKGSALEENMADWVLVANILHQAEPERILREAAHVVRQEGKVVIVEWGVQATPFGPPNESRISVKEVESIARDTGLVLVERFEPSPYHYGMILSKKV